jgi:3-deoxy-D-manno-octulosonic-acid transferase
LWVHAVSVGEVGVAAALIGSLPREIPVLVTTVTPTGQRRARALLGERAAIAYLPFELGFAIRRFMNRFRPRALVLSEGDFWPLILRRAKRDRLPIAVVNGRVSDRGIRRMRRLRRFLGLTLGHIDHFSVQTVADRERLLELGVPGERVAVTGNLKYETPEPGARVELAARFAGLAHGRPILLAGSTMSGEEAAVIEAFRHIGGGERALLVIAPRHPERWTEVDRLLGQAGLVVVKRSDFDGEPVAPETRPDVVLLDSLGELAGLYRIAAIAFVGGTLSATGGHNPLEPARFGVPVVVGPSMENFRQIAEEFDRERAWKRVENERALAATWLEWLDAPATAAAIGQRGAALVAANRGALARTVTELDPILERFRETP